MIAWIVASESFLRGLFRLGAQPLWMGEFFDWLQGVIGGPVYVEPGGYVESNPLAVPAHIYPPWYAYPIIAIWTSWRWDVFGEIRDEIAVIVTFLTMLLPATLVFAPAERLRLFSASLLPSLILPIAGLGFAGFQKTSLEPDTFSRVVTFLYIIEFAVFIPFLMYIVRISSPADEF